MLISDYVYKIPLFNINEHNQGCKMKILVTIAIIAINLTASGFYEIDTKASSIGGAGLTNSAYFNPAVLANKKSIDFSFKMRGDVKTDKNSISLLNDIQNLAKSSTTGGFEKATTALGDSITNPLKNPSALLKLNDGQKIKMNLSDEDANTIKDVKRIIQNASTIRIDASTGLGINLNVKNYSLAWIQNISVDISPVVNSDKLEIIKDVDVDGEKKYIKVDLDSKEMSQVSKSEYDNNSLFIGKKDLEKSTINANIVSLTEIPFIYSYRHNVNYKSDFDGYLYLGLSAKYMLLKKELISFGSKEDMKINDYLDKIANSKSYSSGSLDFGLLYHPKKIIGLKTGIVFKNITSPSFDDKTLKPMVRYGIAFDKWDIKTAFDYDITKNKTLSGQDTQIMGGGIGYHPYSWLGASIGFKKDLANEHLGTILTTGFNLSALHISAGFSDNKFYQVLFNINI